MRNCLILVFIMLLTCDACKYSDGPLISFRGHERRLVNSWSFDFVQRNGNDVMEGSGPGSINYSLSSIGFNDNGRFNVVWAYVDGVKDRFDGSWKFEDKDRKVVLDYDDSPEMQQTFEITRLKNNSMWWEESLPGDITYEYRLKGKE